MTSKELLIEKFTSGRFLFTLTTALVFAAKAIDKSLPIDKVSEVILLVIYAYFTRPDRKPENGGNRNEKVFPENASVVDKPGLK